MKKLILLVICGILLRGEVVWSQGASDRNRHDTFHDRTGQHVRQQSSSGGVNRPTVLDSKTKKEITNANHEFKKDFITLWNNTLNGRYQEIIKKWEQKPVIDVSGKPDSIDVLFIKSEWDSKEKYYYPDLSSDDWDQLKKDLNPQEIEQSSVKKTIMWRVVDIVLAEEKQEEFISIIWILQQKLNPNENKLQVLVSAAETRIEERESSFREWYTSECQIPFNASASIDLNLQEIILDYFVGAPSEEEITTAEALRGLLQSMGIRALEKKDCERRPWYVVGCFFEFMNVSQHIMSDNPLHKEIDLKLCEFLPEKPYITRSELGDGAYVAQVPGFIKKWLVEKFAYPEEELKEKSIGQLVEILEEQLRAVRPYHRYLYKNLSAPDDSKVKEFLEFITFDK